MYYRSLSNCPNCKREFYANVEGEYCPECWSAWGKGNEAFKRREKSWPGQAKTRSTGEEFAVLTIVNNPEA